MDLAGPDRHRLISGGDSGLPSTHVVENEVQIFWWFQYIQRKDGGLSYFPEKSTDLVGGKNVASGIG
ncbi:hypothetical protein V2O64_10305 [Verrucomicrobiaceae bacterium 227]